jgi:hypothetical protein
VGTQLEPTDRYISGYRHLSQNFSQYNRDILAPLQLPGKLRGDVHFEAFLGAVLSGTDHGCETDLYDRNSTVACVSNERNNKTFAKMNPWEHMMPMTTILKGQLLKNSWFVLRNVSAGIDGALRDLWSIDVKAINEDVFTLFQRFFGIVKAAWTPKCKSTLSSTTRFVSKKATSLELLLVRKPRLQRAICAFAARDYACLGYQLPTACRGMETRFCSAASKAV